MNSEIYYLYKDKKKMSSQKEDSNEIVDVLLKNDIKVMYNTNVAYDGGKIISTLKQTQKGKDKIDIVLIFNGLGKTNTCPVIEAFEKIAKPIDGTTSQSKGKKGNVIRPIYSLGDMGNGYNACFTVCDDVTLIAFPKSELSGVSNAEMVKKAVDRLNNSDLIEKTNNSQSEYDYFSYEHTKVSPLSWKYYVPVKGDSTIECVRKILFMVAIIAVVVSGGIIIKSKLIEPAQVQGTYDELKDLYYNAMSIDDESSDGTVKTDKDSDGVIDSFKTLIAINDEVQGWIYIPNTKNVDYPVLYSKSDNASYQKYLYQDFKGNTSNYGSIFIDYRSNKGVDSKNVILHGHNSGNNLMFSEICNYKSLGFYQSTPTFTFTNRKETSEYVVFAVFITNTRNDHGIFFDYLKGSFNTESEFINYVYQCRMRSLINTPVTVNENDTLMTLSTCSYEYKEFRTVVVARKIRENEKENGFSFSTSNAYYNSNPVYPKIWYQDRGGRPPATTTFENVYSSGGISWYDGNGISGPMVDPGYFFINESPDYNEVASQTTSSETTSSEEDTSSAESSDDTTDDVLQVIPDESSPSDTTSSEFTESIPTDEEVTDETSDIPLDDEVSSQE